jgi:hypothetical protein
MSDSVNKRGHIFLDMGPKRQTSSGFSVTQTTPNPAMKELIIDRTQLNDLHHMLHVPGPLDLSSWTRRGVSSPSHRQPPNPAMKGLMIARTQLRE